MKWKWTVRTAMVLAILAYFPLKFCWLSYYNPQFWVRLVAAAMFWGALASVGILCERKLQ